METFDEKYVKELLWSYPNGGTYYKAQTFVHNLNINDHIYGPKGICKITNIVHHTDIWCKISFIYIDTNIVNTIICRWESLFPIVEDKVYANNITYYEGGEIHNNVSYAKYLQTHKDMSKIAQYWGEEFAKTIEYDEVQKLYKDKRSSEANQMFWEWINNTRKKYLNINEYLNDKGKQNAI